MESMSHSLFHAMPQLYGKVRMDDDIVINEDHYLIGEKNPVQEVRADTHTEIEHELEVGTEGIDLSGDEDEYSSSIDEGEEEEKQFIPYSRSDLDDSSLYGTSSSDPDSDDDCSHLLEAPGSRSF